VAVWRDQDGKVAATCCRRAATFWIDVPGVSAFRFGGGIPGVEAMAGPRVSDEALAETHRRLVMPLALQALGHEVLHASAVGGRDGAVALCGLSGAGKSTLAYGLARRGFDQLADDAVVIELRDEIPWMVPLPFRPRLSGEAMNEIDGAQSHLRAHAPPGMAAPGAPCRLAEVIVLESAEGRSEAVELTRLESSAALLALLSHAYCFSPRLEGRLRPMMTQYLAVAAAVPISRLRLERGWDRWPELLDVVAERLA
jgi:hypothetical protein